MQNVSKEYKDAMKKPFRNRGYISARIGIVSSIATENIIADDKNNVFRENDIKYYMFVDIVSYYHKVENKYQVNEKAYYSSLINYNNN